MSINILLIKNDNSMDGRHSLESRLKISAKLTGNKNGLGNKSITGQHSWNYGIKSGNHGNGFQKGQTSWNKGMKNYWMVGAKHPNWNGGSSRYYKTGYYSIEYKNWRKSVFERDHYTCQDCNKKGIYLTAHHIKSQAQYPEFRYDIDNGKTLCEECHKKTDNYAGRIKMKKVKV